MLVENRCLIIWSQNQLIFLPDGLDVGSITMFRTLVMTQQLLVKEYSFLLFFSSFLFFSLFKQVAMEILAGNHALTHDDFNRLNEYLQELDGIKSMV